MEINPTILLLAKNPKEARIKQLKLEKMRTAALQQSSKPPNAATPVREKNLPQNKPSNRKYQTKKQATTLGNKPVPKPNSKPGTTRATRSMSRSSSQTEPPCDNTPQNLPSRSQEQNIVEQTSTQNTNTSPQSETPTQDPTPNPNPNPQPIHSHIPPQPNTSGRTGLTSPLSLMSILRHMATTSPTPMDDNILDREENPSQDQADKLVSYLRALESLPTWKLQPSRIRKFLPLTVTRIYSVSRHPTHRHQKPLSRLN